ncbi:TPA: hypothetical protein DEP21_06260 [Patescibacteria group bacterium]|nr:hypothetical protein [Candidatus Gracilibacteria bacterium]
MLIFSQIFTASLNVVLKKFDVSVFILLASSRQSFNGFVSVSMTPFDASDNWLQSKGNLLYIHKLVRL